MFCEAAGNPFGNERKKRASKIKRTGRKIRENKLDKQERQRRGMSFVVN